MKKIFLLFVLTAIFATGCAKKEKPVPIPLSVTVVPAVMGNVVSATEIIGQAKAYDEVDLVARVQGFLTKINFTEGATSFPDRKGSVSGC
jgi:membrane fusion protein (multidrug efflux system)